METLVILPQRKISLFVQVTGFIFFSILFWFCWRFYLERIISFDGSFYVFQLMQSENFTSSPGRYGDYLAEILPLIAYKMDFPLHTILLVYSVSFIIIHYLVFLFVTLILKNNGAGIGIMLASCLAYYYAFYLPTMELHESIVLGILLWAIIHPEYPYANNKQRNMAAGGAFATIFTMSYFHPLGIFLVGFVIGTEIIGSKRYKDIQLWAVAVLGMGWYILKFFFLSKQSYDQEQLLPFNEMFTHLSDWKAWLSTNYLSDHTWLHFHSLKWLAILCVVLSLRKGILAFLFFVVYIVGYTFIFLANYQKGASPVAYESYYIAYGFFVGLLFVFLFYHPRRRNLVMLLALPFLYSGLTKIYQAHDIFTYRLSYLQRIIDEAHYRKEKKCIIDSKCYPDDYALAPWDIAFETLVYSSLEGHDSTVTVFIKTPGFDKLCDTVQNKHNIFLGVHFSPLWYTSDDMPEGYFKLPSTGYTYLTHSQEDTAFHESIFSVKNIKIRPLVKTIHVKRNNSHTVIPIEITNTSGKQIFAIPRSRGAIYLTYRLYNEKGKLISKLRQQPFETDIGTQSEQGMILYYPRDKGIYQAEPDFVTEDKGYWNIPVQRVTVSVE